MEQEIKPAIQENPKRNPNGTFPAGVSGNPGGENGQQKGWQRFGPRAQRFLNMSADDLSDLLNDKKRRNQLSSYDLHIARRVQNMAMAESTTEVRTEGESVLNRVEGEPKKSLALTGDEGGAIQHDHTIAASDKAFEFLAAVAAARQSGLQSPIPLDGEPSQAGATDAAGGLADMADPGGQGLGQNPDRG